MGEPRIAFVSREVYPFDAAGLGNYVVFTAAALADVAEVTIVTTEAHRAAHAELAKAGDPRLPEGVRFEFVSDPSHEEAAGWNSQLHLWSARVLDALARIYPDGGPDLVEFPDYLGEACVTVQAARTLDPRVRHTTVCVRAYTTSEVCAVLDGHLPDEREMRQIWQLERFALRYADRFVWPGGAVLAAFRSFYGDDGIASAVEIPHTVLPDPEPAVAPTDDDGGVLRLLYVGRLERRKGVQNLVRAAISLPVDDWRLTLVGADTPTAPLGHSMRDQLSLMIAGDPRIELRSAIPREELRSLYAGADVCISPSLWECWPNTVLEALEQNRPVLATPVGGHLGMVEPGASGWLLPDTGSAALAARLERLLAEREAAAGLIDAGGPRRRFEQLADPEPVRERYLELARNSRSRKRPATPAERPLVSVIVPFFKMERHVEETLDSIAAQTYERIETIIVNDGSLGGEQRFLATLAERFGAALVTQINSGLGQARNLGVDMSRGRYVLPVDPDDTLMPTFVERCVAVLEARPDVAYVTAWTEYMDEDGVPIGEEGYRPLGNGAAWLERENVGGSAMAVIRRRPFDRGLRYSADLTAFEDWLLFLELADDGQFGHVIPEVLLRYRVRSGSMLRAVARPSRERLLGELRANAREREVAWTRSSA